MEIGQKFNKLTLKEYYFYIDNYKKYTDFNTLGLYRSIIENEKLDLQEKLLVRDHAHKTFRKAFDFLQLKDPQTFIKVEYLGQELTEGDEEKIWKDLIKNQEKILSNKKIKHRNFGIYSKHNCGYETCVFDGIMVRQGTWLADNRMCFDSDDNNSHNYTGKVKSDARKAARKNEKNIISKELDHEM